MKQSKRAEVDLHGPRKKEFKTPNADSEEDALIAEAEAIFNNADTVLASFEEKGMAIA